MSKTYDAVGLVPGTVAPSTRVRRWDHALLAGGFTFAATYPALMALAWLIPGGQLVRFPMALVGGLEAIVYVATATISRRGPAQEFLAIAATHDQTLLRVGVCAALSLLAAGWMFARAARPVSNTRHLSGPRLLEGEEALKECQRRTLTKKEREADPWHFFIHPALALRKKQWSRHVMLVGSPGSGKTQAMLPFLQQLFERNAKTFLYDVKGDFTSYFEGNSVAIVSPFDRRSYVWDVGRDVRTPTQAAAFAASLIPEAEGNGKFWSVAAQQLLTGALRSLQNTRGTDWGWKDLADTLAKDAAQMRPMLEEHYAKAVPLVSNEESASTASVLMTLAGYTRVIDDLATAWPERTGRMFSITDWAKDSYTGRKRQIIVQAGPDPTLTKAYIAAMVNVCVPTIVGPGLEEDEEGRCLAFVLDELPSLGWIDLPPLVDKGRSKGVIVMMGLQDLAQMRMVYGPDQTKAIESMVATKIICQIQPGETREETARVLGKRKVAWHHNGEKAQVHEETRNVVSAGKLTSELGFRKGKHMGPSKWGIRAIVFTEGGDPLLLNFPGVSPPKVRRGQVAAKWTTQPAGANPKPAPAVPTAAEETRAVIGLTLDDLNAELDRIYDE